MKRDDLFKIGEPDMAAPQPRTTTAANEAGSGSPSDWALVQKLLADGFPDAHEAVRIALVRRKEAQDAIAFRTCLRCGAVRDR
jgi:hypothetical protein